jgi:class 3 adenylate cyclase
MAGVSAAEFEALGLYDPEAPLAHERLELLGYLLDLGATVDDLLSSRAELSGLASTLALRGAKPSLTQAEAAEQAGVSPEEAAELWRAVGFPDPGPTALVCTHEDVESLRLFRGAKELFGDDIVRQLARVIGSSMARVADAMVSAFLVNIGKPVLTEDPSGLTLARTNSEAIALLRETAKMMDLILRRQVELMQRPILETDPDTQLLAIGFADLVDSAGLAQRLSVKELGAALGEFDELVTDIVMRGGGRVVKLIGDEVMYVAAAPDTACAIALDLADHFADHPRLPPVRAGVGFGEVLSRDGDYFGTTVNLAARVVKLAAPGHVIALPRVREVADGFVFISLGDEQIRGFSERIEIFEVTTD